MHPALTLPHLTLSIHCWLYAYSASAAGLLVYKTPLIRDTDEMFREVADILNGYPLRVVLEEKIPDPGMMMGQGQLTVYRPVYGDYPDEQVYVPGFIKKLRGVHV